MGFNFQPVRRLTSVGFMEEEPVVRIRSVRMDKGAFYFNSLATKMVAEWFGGNVPAYMQLFWDAGAAVVGFSPNNAANKVPGNFSFGKSVKEREGSTGRFVTSADLGRKLQAHIHFEPDSDGYYRWALERDSGSQEPAFFIRIDKPIRLAE